MFCAQTNSGETEKITFVPVKGEWLFQRRLLVQEGVGYGCGGFEVGGKEGRWVGGWVDG